MAKYQSRILRLLNEITERLWANWQSRLTQTEVFGGSTPLNRIGECLVGLHLDNGPRAAGSNRRILTRSCRL